MTLSQQGRAHRAGGMSFSSFLMKAAAACLIGLAATQAPAQDAGALRQKYGELRAELRDSPFQRPLYIDSAHGDGALQGDVYAVLDHPLPRVSQNMREPARWCDILILPFNTKYCHAVDGNGGPALQVRIGRKYDQPVERAFRLEFALRNVAARAKAAARRGWKCASAASPRSRPSRLSAWTSTTATSPPPTTTSRAG
jgi:hypothetical protein